MMLNIIDISFPLTDPVLKFLVILVIILFAPILLNRLKIPSILGLIIAGVVIGPHGLNMMERDSGIILSGTAGLLYIMFLAGLDIDLAGFRKNRYRSLWFGFLTFIIPMLLGFAAGRYVLGFALDSSALLGGMFASHTLIAYPLIAKYGVTKNRAVTIAVGGTMITDTLALFVLATIVGLNKGEASLGFWLKLGGSTVIAIIIITAVFPLIARWFFKRFKDKVAQYIFVLALVFLGAALSELAGIEGIIGAFLTGLSLNKLIPSASPLMNRVEFVGNAIFIPFFLIGVGMLVDYKAFFRDFGTLEVAALMIIIALCSKYAAAWVTQKTLRFTSDERQVMFGLSASRVAATLAIVSVGYNLIVSYTDVGEPVRLLSESVLNGTIIMILITCTVASFAAQRSARNISLMQTDQEDSRTYRENILIPVKHPDNLDELISLSAILKKKQNKHGLYALNVLNIQDTDTEAHKKATELLEKAQKAASVADIRLSTLLRYDNSVPDAITSVIRENAITDLILGLHIRHEMSESFLGNLTENILARSNVTTCIYRPVQPIATVARHHIVIPQHAETEFGFPFWMMKMLNLGRKSELIFYGSRETLNVILNVHLKHHINARYVNFNNWDDFLTIADSFESNDGLIVVMSRRDKASYQTGMRFIPQYLNNQFNAYNFMLIYPMQLSESERIMNASLLTGSSEAIA
jgi:Kef-type K+ transport system membrane component KefB